VVQHRDRESRRDLGESLSDANPLAPREGGEGQGVARAAVRALVPFGFGVEALRTEFFWLPPLERIMMQRLDANEEHLSTLDRHGTESCSLLEAGEFSNSDIC